MKIEDKRYKMSETCSECVIVSVHWLVKIINWQSIEHFSQNLQINSIIAVVRKVKFYECFSASSSSFFGRLSARRQLSSPILLQ